MSQARREKTRGVRCAEERAVIQGSVEKHTDTSRHIKHAYTNVSHVKSGGQSIRAVWINFVSLFADGDMDNAGPRRVCGVKYKPQPADLREAPLMCRVLAHAILECLKQLQHRQTDRQTDRQTHTHTEAHHQRSYVRARAVQRHTHRQTDTTRQTDGQTDPHPRKCAR